MPRASAEARAAANWRSGARHPAPPKHLSHEAKVVWREVVEARPADFFEAGSLHLLETFCTHTVHLRRVAKQLDLAPAGLEMSKEYSELVATSTRLGTSVAQLAQKLRLSIQSALRTESRKNDERAPQEKGRRSLGGGSVPMEKLN